ncbi:MAG: thiamine pyrophosphate-dependent dehydrogenase E1 component subunit alpha [Chloroflexi bacterium]|nr:thiamine pyrophosphate-dependent dehydrogenase E1 component subunit alpha [Chloroflexota bacterium]
MAHDDYAGPPRVRIPLAQPADARRRRANEPQQTHPHFDLPNEALVEMWYLLLLSRRIAERWFTLNRQGRAPFVVTGQGQEAAQVGTAAALVPGKDWVLPYYRDIGVMLTLGMTVEEFMLNVLAKATDPNSGGRQMPAHWSAKELRVVSQSSTVGTQIPMAAGLAWASQLRGEDAVAVCYIGEGATAQGDFHEGLNFAAVRRLPVILVVENNGYAITEAQEKGMPVEHVADRAPAYGMKGIVVDGNDIMLVYRNMHQLVEETRRGGGPAILELKTYRTVPHSSDDDDRRYRTRAELEQWLKRDPVDRFRARLINDGILTDAHAADLDVEADQEVREALARAEGAPDPDPATLLDHLFAAPPWDAAS